MNECESKCDKFRRAFAPALILSIYRRKYDCCIVACEKQIVCHSEERYDAGSNIKQ